MICLSTIVFIKDAFGLISTTVCVVDRQRLSHMADYVGSGCFMLACIYINYFLNEHKIRTNRKRCPYEFDLRFQINKNIS